MLVVDVIAERLRERSVRFVFGMPWGYCSTDGSTRGVGIEFVLVRHEGSAGFMADVVFSGREDSGSYCHTWS